MSNLVRTRVPLTMLHDGLGPGWTNLWLRDGSDDWAILEEIMVGDAYHVRSLRLDRDPNEQRATVIDLGANVGIFALTCAQKGARVFAYEPQAENYELLVRNVHDNAAGDRVQMFNMAVGSSRGYVTIDGGGGTGHVMPGEDVECTTLADILAPHAKVDLLKIDVEGAEHDILTACPHDQLAKIDRIVGELHGPAGCAWLEDIRWGEIIEHLMETHAVDCFGKPSEGGGLFYAHSL